MPILDQNDARAVARYEEFVATSPYGAFGQSVHWAEVKNNWNADYVYLEEGGEMTAALSIISVKTEEGGSLCYAPRGPVAAMTSPEIVQQLLAEAGPVLEARDAFVLRMDPEVIYSEEILSLYGAGQSPAGAAASPATPTTELPALRIRTRGENIHSFSNPRYNMMVDLTGADEDALFARLEGKFRNKIRRSARAGVEVATYTKEDAAFPEKLDTFYEMTEIMAERQGISHRPKAYFQRLFDAFPNVTLFEATHEGEPLAGCILLGYNKKAFYIYAASTNEKRNLNASALMNWEAIRFSLARGYAEYDMGGIFEIDDNDGLYRFKKKFTGPEGLHEFVGEWDLVLDEEKYQAFLRRQEG